MTSTEGSKKGGGKNVGSGGSGSECGSGSLVGYYTVTRSVRNIDTWTRVTKEIAEHVGITFGREMTLLVAHQQETTFTAPSLGNGASRQDELKWSKDYDAYLKKKTKYEEDKARVFATILSRCDEPLKNRLECHATFDSIEKAGNVVKLIQMIKESAFDSSGREYAPQMGVMVLKQMTHLHQLDDESLVQYFKRFNDMVDRAERKFGPLTPMAVVSKDKSRKTQSEKESKAREQLLAVLFMEGGNRGYKPLLNNLKSDYALGSDMYPDTLHEALQVMMVHQESPIYRSIMKKKAEKVDEQEPLEVSFAQMTKAEKRKKGLCFQCGSKWQPGHTCATPGTGDNNVEEAQQHTQTGAARSHQRQGSMSDAFLAWNLG